MCSCKKISLKNFNKLNNEKTKQTFHSIDTVSGNKFKSFASGVRKVVPVWLHFIQWMKKYRTASLTMMTKLAHDHYVSMVMLTSGNS